MAETRRASFRSWWSSTAMMLCMGLAWIVASSAADRAVRITALLGLAGVATGLSFLHALGFKRESPVLRAFVLVPAVFCIVLTVVLMLDAHFRHTMVIR